MKKITKSDPQLQQIQHFGGAFFIGFLLVVLGGYCILEGFHLLPFTAEIVDSFKRDVFLKHLLSSSPRWEVLLFGCYILLASAIVFVQCIRSWLNKRDRIALAKQNRQTWFLDYPWNPKGIHDRTGKIWIKSLFGTLLFSLIIIPLNWYTFFQGSIQSWILLILAILFDLAMLVLLGSLIYYIIHSFQYGNSFLVFGKFPFFPGDKMKVTFSPNCFSALKCTLRFIKEAFEKERPGDEDKTIVCYELYSEQKLIRCSPKTPKVSISFDIPETSPTWSNELDGNKSIYYWELEVKAEHPGVDFNTSFLIPVYNRQD